MTAVRHTLAGCPADLDTQPCSGGRGPCLCIRDTEEPPPAPIVRPHGETTEVAVTAATVNFRRRAVVRTCQARLTEAPGGPKRWSDARDWATSTGRWMPADLRGINETIVDAYLTHLTEQDEAHA